MDILIVDDSDEVRGFLKILLSGEGHAVREAGNGQEGLARAREQRPDVVICDGLMPVMDGFQFLQALKRDSGLSSIPFIFLSAVYTGQREHDLAISLGADAFLVKPQPPKAILDALQAVTGGRVKTARTAAALNGDDAASAREYSLVVATALEGKVGELRTASDEWRATFDAMTEAVALLDADGRIMRCNRALAALAKKPFNELIGRACSDMCECFGGTREACPFTRCKQTLKRETVVFRKGERWFEVSADPIMDETGALRGAVHILQEITERKKAEEALHEQQRFTENLIMNSAIATFVLDADHKVLIWNKACEELTGVLAADMVGTNGQWKPFYDHERPVLADIVLAQEKGKLSSFYESIAPSTLTQEGLHAEGWYRNLHNRDRYIVFDAAPIRNSGGQTVAAIETLLDFSARKRAEEQIFQAKQDWEFTFNSITDMVTVHDADYNIVLANKAAEKILHLPLLEKMKDRKCFSYYHGADHAPEGCPGCGCLQTGVAATFELLEPHLNMFIEIRAIPRFDSNDKLIGLIHVVRDISERRKSEEAQAAYSRELTALNTASNSLMLITNLRDIYQKICDIIYGVFDLKMVWLGVIGDDSFEVSPVASSDRDDGYLSTIKVTWDDSVHGRGPTGMAIKTRATMKMNIYDPAFAAWKTVAEARGYVASMAVPLIYARDKCIGVLNFYSDKIDYFTPDRIKLCQIFSNQAAIAIENARLVEGLEGKVRERTKEMEDANVELQTLNKELELRREEADAASRSKTDFLANMSHELRTPLNAIMGFSEIMLMGMAGPVSDKQKEFLGDISKSGNHLLSLINDILDLSKVEAGKLELELELVNVAELISGSLMMFKEKALKHSLTMGTFIDPAVTELVADRRMLKQVLVNLLSNACKFTPDGGSVRVSARLMRNAEFGIRNEDEKTIPQSAFGIPHLEISVADTGVGISKEHQEKLFRPFMQIDSSLTRNHAGTGLGLSLCRRFVELHGGRIWVESEPGKGSTFRFVVPVRQGAKERSSEEVRSKK